MAAAVHGISAPTARKWLGRYLAQGAAGLRDASSRPRVSPRAIVPARALAVIELRRRRLTQALIARSLAVSESTVSRVLRRAGLSRWRDLEPSEPSLRAMSTPIRVTWCAWTPRSWGASFASDIA